MFAEAREFKKNPGEPLFTVVEELIAEVFLDVDIPLQQ
jgi:hypothetical protein